MGGGDAVVEGLRAALRAAEQALAKTAFEPVAQDVKQASARRESRPFKEARWEFALDERAVEDIRARFSCPFR